MSQQQLDKLWTVLAAALVYFTIDTWLAIQGGSGLFGTSLILKEPLPAALIGIPVTGVLTILVCFIGGVRASRSVSRDWDGRSPIFAFDSLISGVWETRAYQGFFIVLSTLLPLAALTHFWRKVAAGKVFPRNPAAPQIDGVWDFSGFRGFGDYARLCDRGASACPDGSTVLPGLEAAAFAGVTTFAALSVIAFVWKVFRD